MFAKRTFGYVREHGLELGRGAPGAGFRDPQDKFFVGSGLEWVVMRFARLASTSRSRKGWFVAGLGLLPGALALRELTFRFPSLTERIYGETIYPRIAGALGTLNGILPFSLAEVLLAILAVNGIGYAVWRRGARGRRRKGSTPRKRSRVVGTLATLWTLTGALGMAFLVLWGFNYARPPLADRLELPMEGTTAEDVLTAGRACAREATRLHLMMGLASDAPSRLPLDFGELNDSVEQGFRALELPGDHLGEMASPAKPLVSSWLFSYLGLSGLFVPFTGEPSINDWVPDASLPPIVAHEKAHQRGITDEGEASFVGFMACAHPEAPPYLRYTAYLFAASRLIGSASRYLPEDEVAAAWSDLGDGPRRDLIAIHDFWSRYEGPAAVVASRLNDTYLRSNRVERGIQSYQRVVELLMALERRGGLVPFSGLFPSEPPAGGPASPPDEARN